MRFIYGFIFGVLASTIGAILYLAFAGGEYLLQLSPHYHEITSEVATLRDAKQQRDQLATRLDMLAKSFDELTRRFGEMQRSPHDAAHPSEPLEAPKLSDPPLSPTTEAKPSATPAS